MGAVENEERVASLKIKELFLRPFYLGILSAKWPHFCQGYRLSLWPNF